MAPQRAPAADWINTAWNLAEGLARLPTKGPWVGGSGLFGFVDERWGETRGSPHGLKRLPIDKLAGRAIVDSLNAVALDLMYRLDKRRRGEGQRIDAELQMKILMARTPRTLREAKRALKTRGIKLQPTEHHAVVLLENLAQILSDRYVDEHVRWQLPVAIASLAGTSASAAARLQAGPRKRKAEPFLKSEMHRVLRDSPEAKWKEILVSLQGDEVVIDWDVERILWRDLDRNEQSTPTTTFRGWRTR